jgi:hypothetical protein
MSDRTVTRSVEADVEPDVIVDVLIDAKLIPKMGSGICRHDRGRYSRRVARD